MQSIFNRKLLQNSSLFFALWITFSPVFVLAQNDVNPNAPRTLLYVTESKRAIASLKAHANAMDIISPQTYEVSAAGKIFGKPNKEILDVSASVGAQVMPLVSNRGFDQPAVHAFLMDKKAQNKFLKALVAEGKDKKYMGFQYDFEHIPSYDRDRYSDFVARSVPILHAAGMQLSVAVGPRHSDLASDYGIGSWQNWTGAFDYKAIGYYADFVSIMAYDDSKSKGPVASLPWVQEVLNYTLTRIPANKVSLGIPFYAWVWNQKTGKKYSAGYPKLAERIAKGDYLKKGTSDDLGVSWVKFTDKDQTYTAWYEDSDSFGKKYSMVTNNHLRGFSGWVLGIEDPKLWDVVVTSRTPSNTVAER